MTTLRIRSVDVARKIEFPDGRTLTATPEGVEVPNDKDLIRDAKIAVEMNEHLVAMTDEEWAAKIDREAKLKEAEEKAKSVPAKETAKAAAAGTVTTDKKGVEHD